MTRDKRNYGFGRRADFAGKQVLRERYGGGHFSTVATHAQRWATFCRWAAEAAVKDMRQVDEQLVQRYADHLRETGHAVSSRQNAVSTINIVMTHASQGQWANLSPRQLAGEARRSVRDKVPASLNSIVHRAAVESMRERGMNRAAAIADLARTFGVRSEEAVKADLDRWQREAGKLNAVNVLDGCKGGRNADRWVPMTEDGRAALTAALDARPVGSRNLLGASETYVQARESWMREGREAYAEATGGSGYHDARAAYACDRYQDLTGHAAPVVGGGMSAGRDADLAARSIIVAELGHGRIDVVAAYIGGRR